MADLDKRPGAGTTTDQTTTAPGAATSPGKSSLAGGALPRTTAQLGAGPIRVTADRLNVRSTPEVKQGNVLGGLLQGAVVQSTERAGDWIRILFHSADAFVNKQFVEPAPLLNAAQPAPAEPQHADAPAAAHPSTTQPTAAATPPPAAPSTTASTAPAPGSTASAPHEDAAATEPAIATSATSAVTPMAPAQLPGPAAPATDASIAAPQALPAAAYGGQFLTASGNAVDATSKDEATVLNQIRRDPHRFDPVWLEAAQHALGVHDATGAMNTETLRAMREHAHNPKLGASAIMSETFLTSLAPGKPFHEGVDTGENNNKQPADTTKTTPKDRAAQGLGYADYEGYVMSWGKDAVTFLSKNLRTPAHPYLRARLRVAEAYLRNRMKSPSGEVLDDAGIRKAIGWSGVGNASYHHETDANMNLTHPHAMGHAIDIDPGQNPYFFDHSQPNATFWVELFEHLFQHATKLYGGSPLTAATMLQWSKEMSTEELFHRIKTTSSSFAMLLELSTRNAHAPDREEPTGEISTALANVGYKDDALKTATHEVAVANHHFQQQEGRKNAKQATNLTMELVIALRDVAGLAWGGTEMSGIENGDFMHFDCRLTDFGVRVAAAAAAAHQKPANKKPESK